MKNIKRRNTDKKNPKVVRAKTARIMLYQNAKCVIVKN